MITLVIITLVALTVVSIRLYEDYNKKMFIAGVVDGQKVDWKFFISEECQLVIIQLRNKQNLRITKYNSTLTLPDGQEISYRFDNLIKMKLDSKLKFEPSPLEWEILRELVKKVISY